MVFFAELGDGSCTLDGLCSTFASEKDLIDKLRRDWRLHVAKWIKERPGEQSAPAPGRPFPARLLPIFILLGILIGIPDLQYYAQSATNGRFELQCGFRWISWLNPMQG